MRAASNAARPAAARRSPPRARAQPSRCSPLAPAGQRQCGQRDPPRHPFPQPRQHQREQGGRERRIDAECVRVGDPPGGERGRTGLTLTELTRRVGIAKSTVSQLEAATGNPSVETLWALATALGVPFSTAIPSDTGHFTGTLLSSCPPGARRDVYLVTLEPGTPRQAEAHIPGTVEHAVVSAGRMRTGPTGAEIELAPGDYAAFPGDVPPATVAVLVMEHV